MKAKEQLTLDSSFDIHGIAVASVTVPDDGQVRGSLHDIPTLIHHLVIADET